MVYLEDKKTISSAKMIAEAEMKIEEAIQPLFVGLNKRIPKNVLSGRLAKVFEDCQTTTKKSTEQIYGSSLRRSIDPGLKIQNRNKAKEIAQSYSDQFDEYKSQGLETNEILYKMQYKVGLISSTESTRIVNKEVEYQLKLKTKKSIWKAILDRKTCKDCKKLNNKVTTKLPGLHPRCRCVIVYTVI